MIASALSIQDVRERPKESPEQAAELHRRFDVEGSDLLSIVALWDHLRDRQRELSGNQFRRMCRDEYLNYLRVREWRDLYSQLRQVAGQLKIRPSVDDAHPDHVHRAVLAGLLSHIGHRDGDGQEYRAAQGRPLRDRSGFGAGQAADPKWVMAGRAGRDEPTVGPTGGDDPARMGRGARRRTSSSTRTAIRGGTPERVGPSWPRRSRCSACRSSNARTIGVGRVDPRLAREMFIRHALVAGDWETHHEFLATNARFVERVALLEARVRRIDLLDDEALYEFYDERLGDDVTSGRDFDRWWKHARRATGHSCSTSIRRVLRNRRGIALEDYPDTWPAARRRTGGHVPTDVPVRAEHPARRRDAQRAADRAQSARRQRVRLAGARLSGRSRRIADPLAAEGHPARR